MALANATIASATLQAPPIVQELEGVFARLDDNPLIKTLIGPTRRGPKGYPTKVLWHCFITKYVLGLESTSELIQTLLNNPFIAEVCGLGSIPHKSTFSRFFTKLAKYQHLVKDVSRSLVRKSYETLPGFGDRVSIDSTHMKGWSNGSKSKKADKEAGWAVKQGTQGTKEYTYGWKLHLLVDCEYELPIAANISPGNVHDVTRASNVLSEARYTYHRFHPHYLMADKGYSSSAFISLVSKQYWASPIVKIHPNHKKLLNKWRPVTSMPEWQALYQQRTSVERTFSRLKEQRALNHLTTRGLRKVTVHCYLSMIALQAKALC